MKGYGCLAECSSPINGYRIIAAIMYAGFRAYHISRFANTIPVLDGMLVVYADFQPLHVVSNASNILIIAI